MIVLGAIKKFSAWRTSVQNKIKLLFASYSSKAQNTTCTIWLLGFNYFLYISAYEQNVSQMVPRMPTPELRTSFWKTSRTITTWPSKNLFHNSLFSMKRGCTTSILSQNNKACNGTNESVKIVILLLCVTPFFHVVCKQLTTAKMHKIFIAQKVILCMSCSEPCYYEKQILF